VVPQGKASLAVVQLPEALLTMVLSVPLRRRCEEIFWLLYWILLLAKDVSATIDCDPQYTEGLTVVSVQDRTGEPSTLKTN
jgi:hypothetical protein